MKTGIVFNSSNSVVSKTGVITWPTLTAATIPAHKSVLINTHSTKQVYMNLSGKMFLGGTYGDSRNTLETNTVTIQSYSGIVLPIRFSSISGITMGFPPLLEPFGEDWKTDFSITLLN